MSVSVNLRGFDQARDNVAELVERVSARQQVEAVKKGASVLQAAAAARVPRSAGPPTRGGRHLNEAIETEVRSEEKDHVSVAVGPAKEQYHGIFFELGTMDMPADPYLRPAADQQGEEAIRVTREALRQEVVEATVELRKRTR